MLNENETSALADEQGAAVSADETMELPMFPPRPEQAAGSEDNVAQQYRAINDANRAHEEGLEQLREQLRAHSERIEQISASNGAAHGRDDRVDAVVMRLQELERKSFEGAPEPLLNEIVHRLAALETRSQAMGAKDPRVEKILPQIEQLKAKLGEDHADPRTDDVVLRIAALEGTYKRVPQADEIADIKARLERFQEDSLAQARGGSEQFKEQIEQAQERVRALEERLADPSQGAQVDEIRARIEGLESGWKGVEYFEGQLAALETALGEGRLAAEQRRHQLDERIEGLAGRLDAAADRSEQTLELEALKSRLAELESQNATLLEVADRRDSDRESRADELAGRLHELETRTLEASRLGSEVELIAERVDAVEQSAPDEALREEVSELRRLVEKQHSASPALDSRWNELRERLELVSERLSEVESASRPEDLSERFQALEERLSALDQLSGFAGRLAALETAPGNGGERVDELLQRVLALESGGAAGVGEAVAELQSELAALREGIPTTATGGADWSALDERLRELENRADSPLLDNSVMPAALAQQLGEIEDRLAARNHGEHESDPRTTELMGRMSVLEQEYRLSGGRDDLEAVWERLDVLDGALKQAAEGGEDSQRQLERWEALEQRLAEIEQRESQAEGDGSSAEEALALVRSEAERWTSWARTTMEDMGRLRAQVEQLESAKGGSSEDDVSATRAESIAAAVASGLNKGEVKGLRTQMYFVFFAIGILWVLTLVMLLMR